MLSFLKMRQGQTETDDDYLMRFTTRWKNMEISGGEHIVCSLQLIGKHMISTTLGKLLFKQGISKPYVSYNRQMKISMEDCWKTWKMVLARVGMNTPKLLWVHTN